MLTLFRPYKVNRNVILEKFDKNKNIVMEKIVGKKIVRLKRNAAIITSIVSSILLSYVTFISLNLKTNIIEWNSGERATFLGESILGSLLIFFYCSNQMMADINFQTAQEKNTHIPYLSENWFKKLLSVFILFIISFVIIFLILSFCNMSLNLSSLKEENRGMLSIFTCISTLVLCALVYHNNLKIILKIGR